MPIQLGGGRAFFKNLFRKKNDPLPLHDPLLDKIEKLLEKYENKLYCNNYTISYHTDDDTFWFIFNGYNFSINNARHKFTNSNKSLELFYKYYILPEVKNVEAEIDKYI